MKKIIYIVVFFCITTTLYAQPNKYETNKDSIYAIVINEYNLIATCYTGALYEINNDYDITLIFNNNINTYIHIVSEPNRLVYLTFNFELIGFEY